MEIIHRKIAELSLKKFNSLPKTGKPKDNEWTVLSCIVMEQNSIFEVVSLGTGSKCIGKTKMCPTGTIINDCHGEVMCRRAFLRYLYCQLSNDSLIFIFNKETSKFSLKANIKFHFFTSHVPCGDAAIFPKEKYEDIGDVIQTNDLEEDSSGLPTKKRKIADIFRTGAKCLKDSLTQDLKGEGAAYHATGVVRTKPGRGDPTASVSCSDKLAKWCHLGIQGALLMNLLDTPLYLCSFTILSETPFCMQALERALFARMKDTKLTGLYQRHLLSIHQVDLTFSYKKTEERVPCSSSISWFQNGQENLEVASNGRKQGATKKHYLSEKGRLKICKLELFKAFVQKVEAFNIKLDSDCNVEHLTYKKAKDLSKVYQGNWQILQKQLGVWTNKEPTLLNFLPSYIR